MKEHVTIKQVDNGWLIQRNEYASGSAKRETLVCADVADALAILDRILNEIEQ